MIDKETLQALTAIDQKQSVAREFFTQLPNEAQCTLLLRLSAVGSREKSADLIRNAPDEMIVWLCRLSMLTIARGIIQDGWLDAEKKDET